MKTRHLLVILFAVFAIGIFSTQSYAKINPDTIVCLLNFDEGKGDVAKDSSGNGKDGTLMNGPKWVDGKFGKALEYDGKDDYVIVHIGTALQSLSLEAWVYPTEGGIVFVEEGQQALDGGWYDSHMEILGSGEVKVGFWTGAMQGISLGKISLGKWHNIVMTYNKGDNKISGYINGKLVESGALAKQNPGDLWYAIGARTATNMGDGTHFNGIIDKIAIYNVALSEADVKQNFESANAVSPSDKLTATWASIKTE
ncbi:TPA: LamG domain-containing protein [bacterium]|nr:LamG domain-containing protein [bacterium]